MPPIKISAWTDDFWKKIFKDMDLLILGPLPLIKFSRESGL